MFLNIGEVFDSKAKTAGLIKSKIKSNKKIQKNREIRTKASLLHTHNLII